MYMLFLLPFSSMVIFVSFCDFRPVVVGGLGVEEDAVLRAPKRLRPALVNSGLYIKK